MTTKAVFFFFLVSLSVHYVYPQAIRTPTQGSAERKALLDAVRRPVETELKQKVVFVIENFNVSGPWAFISGTPQATDGSEPNYRGTRYNEAVDAGAFDNNFFALLHRTGGKWKTVTLAIGCTDVCYSDWWRTYRAPKAIFPYTE